MQEAELLLTETINLYYRIDRKKLLKQKYNCIQTIKEHYDLQQLFLTRIPQYKILASIYKIFESKMIQQSYNPVDIIGSKQIILQFLTNNIQLHSQTEQVVENFIRQDKDIQMLAYKLLIEKFNKKYKNNLNQNQKCLLQKYLNSFSNIGVLKQYLDINVPIIINQIQSLNKKIEDSVVKIKLQQVLHQLNTIVQGKIIKDSHVIALLKTYSLLEQLKNI